MHRDSCECSKTELDMFAMPPTMITMQEAQWVEHHPISSLTSSAPIEFEIKGQTEEYIDLNNSYLYLKVKVLRTDDSMVENDDRVAPVNNFMHALFNEVDLYLNNKLVSSSTDTYPYRAYLENLGKEISQHEIQPSSKENQRRTLFGTDGSIAFEHVVARQIFTERTGSTPEIELKQ